MESQRKDMEAKREEAMDQMKTEIELLQQEKKERMKIYEIEHMYAN